jgi:hypothetical protein
MNDPMAAILQPDISPTNIFPASSRYHGIESALVETEDGRVRIYLRRRFVPSPDRFQTLQEHVVTEGERLDNITWLYLGDPLLFWRLGDANNAMQPDALTDRIGSRLRIPLPEGIEGSTL